MGLLLASCSAAQGTAKPTDSVSLIRGEEPASFVGDLIGSVSSSDSVAFNRAAELAGIFGKKHFIDPDHMPSHYRGFYIDKKNDVLHIYCTQGQTRQYDHYFPDDPNVVIEESAYSYAEHRRILQDLGHVPGLAFCQDVPSQPDRFVLVAWADTAELAESFILNNPNFKDYLANIDIYKNSIKWADLIADRKAPGIKLIN